MQKSHCGHLVRFLKTGCEKLFLDQLVVQVSLHMAPSFLVNVQLFVCFLLLFGRDSLLSYELCGIYFKLNFFWNI